MTFTEIVKTTVAEAEEVFSKTRMVTDPPDGLAAVVGWESGPDEVTMLMVWSDAGARGDFAAERMMPLLEDGSFRPATPQRLHPTHLFFRDGDPLLLI